MGTKCNIINGLSNHAYHYEEPYSDYLSSSALKIYARSPKAFKFAVENPDESQSDALRIGSLFHSYMECAASHTDMASDAIASLWMQGIAVFDPPVNDKTGQPYGAATKAYKEAYDGFIQTVGNKAIASRDELLQVQGMAESLLSGCGATSEQVRKLLGWAKGVEVSYFYENEDGIKLKARPDLLTKNKIIDWKTCSLDSLDEDNIVRQIIRYRYDVSLSQYQYIIHEIDGRWLTPILVFVQKQPPYDAVMCDISEWCYQYNKEFDLVTSGVGAMEFSRLLAMHTECVKNGEWPGAETAILAEDSTRIMKPKIPAYFGMKYYND